MNAPLQISGNSAAGASFESGLFNPTPVSAGAANQQFSVLLSMLDSLLANAGQQASCQADNSRAQNPAISASSLPGSSAAAASLKPLDLISAGETPKGKTCRGQTENPTAYLPAGIPFISPYQIISDSQNFSIPAIASQSSSVRPSSDIISKIEEEMASLMKIGQTPTAGGSTLPTTTNTVQSQQDVNGQDAITTLQSSEGAKDGSAKADLLKLISAAMNGRSSNNDMGELSHLIDNMENGSAGGRLTQELKDMAAAVVARQAADITHPIAASIAAPKQATSSMLDPGVPMASAMKAVNQSPAIRTIQGIAVSAGSGNTDAKSAIPATPTVAQNPATASAAASTGSQPAGQADGIALSQIVRADGSQPGRDKQSPSDTGENLSDFLKQGAVQAYTSTSDGSKVDTTFERAMSVAASNSPASAMKPDPVEVAQSIVKQVNLMTQEGKTVVNMKLQPEDLGTVVLKVASQDGKISAEFNVKTPDARAFLETSIPQMRQSLETNGVSLAHLSVSLSTGDSNGGRPQYQAKKQQPKYYATVTTDQVESARTFGYNTMELKV